MAKVTDKSKRSHRRIRFRHVLVAVVIVAIVGVGTALAFRWHWRREFRGRIEALRAGGYPVTVADLEARYPRPEPDADAADVIREAMTYYRDDLGREEIKLVPFIGRGELPPRGQPLDANVREASVRLLDGNRNVLERLDQLPSMERYRYPIDWSSAPGGGSAHVKDTRRSMSLVALSALVACDEGETDAATGSLSTVLEIGQSLFRTPLLYGEYVGRSSQRLAISALEWGLSRTPFTDEQLQRLEEAMAADDSPERFAQTLAGHRCLVLPSLEKPETSPDDHLPPVPVLKAYRALGLAAREGAIYVDVIESYLEVTTLPLHQWPAAAKAIDGTLEEKLKGCLLLFPLSQGGFSGHLIRYLEHKAKLEATKAALAVERYRLAQGRLPGALEMLVPDYLEAVPSDPFDGRPLRYFRLARGFVVYSVGEDGWDDSGAEMPDGSGRRSGQTYDITFTVERRGGDGGS